MTSDSNPVVIIVSEQSTSEKTDQENTVKEKKQSKDGQLSIDQMKQQTIKSHSPVAKHNSCPIPKDHLRVPSAFSNYETASSIYSSDDSLGSLFDQRFRSASDFTDRYSPHYIKESASTLQLSSRTSSSSSKNDKNCFGDPKEFQHLSLKRTVSAPLKTVTDIQRKQEERRIRRLHSPPSRFQLLSPSTWRRSTNGCDDKTSNSTSRFSLRRTLSNTLRSSFNGKENSYEITFPTKSKKKPRQKYRIVDAKTGRNDGISFEVIGKQGTYLRVKGAMLMPDKDTTDTYFNKDCTFVPLPDMWYSTFFAFESLSKPSHFIRLTEHEELVIDKYDGTPDFKEEASFQLNRKPCATCLQVGVQTWAKTQSGEYCLGRVLSMDHENIVVKLEDEKIEKYSKLDTTQFVPDVVPCPDDITIGTRVIAQWLQRHTLYPGVVSSVRNDDNYDVLFDDGDTGRVKKFQIRLVRTYSFSHDNVDHPQDGPHLNGYHHGYHTTEVPTITTLEISSDAVDRPRLWSDPNESPPSLDVPIPQQNHVLSENTTPNLSDKNFTFSPWEIETFSQDSGYHGYNKGNIHSPGIDHSSEQPSSLKQRKRKTGHATKNKEALSLIRNEGGHHAEQIYSNVPIEMNQNLPNNISSQPNTYSLPHRHCTVCKRVMPIHKRRVSCSRIPHTEIRPTSYERRTDNVTTQHKMSNLKNTKQNHTRANSLQSHHVKFKRLPSSFSVPDFFKQPLNDTFENAATNIKATKLITPTKENQNNSKTTKEDPIDISSNTSIDSLVIINHPETHNDIKLKPLIAKNPSRANPETDLDSSTEFVNISLSSLNTIEILKEKGIDDNTEVDSSKVDTKDESRVDNNNVKNNANSNSPSNKKSKKVNHLDVIRERADSVCQKSII